MSRYIDADALIARAFQDSERMYLESVVKHTPSIDIEPKRGEWVNARDGVSDHVKCTNCFRTYYLGIVENYNFCPNCGADMRKESE